MGQTGAVVKLTARGLNRATLARQLLLGRERLGPVEAVHRVMALQAQEPASPRSRPSAPASSLSSPVSSIPSGTTPMRRGATR